MPETGPQAERSLAGIVADRWSSSDAAPAFEDLAGELAGASPRECADAVLVDQRLRWQKGVGASAEEYLRACPAVAADREARLDVVYGEFRARGDGEEVLNELAGRFPDLEDELLRQAEVGSWWQAGDDATVEETHVVQDAAVTEVVTVDPAAPLSLEDFELVERLGRGGMGEVHRAVQKSLDKPVAVKLLRWEGQSPEAAARFLREARATAALRHPHAVDVHGVGRCPDGGYFLVMDLVEGRSLQDEMAAGPLPPQRAAQVVADAAAAVQHAHERGVVHRDLKPSNVLVDSEGRAVVVDFGLAKLLHDAGPQLSTDGTVVGTPQYMAPEQIDPSFGEVGPATDVYGLGALLYALLVGRAPVEGSTVVQTVAHVLSGRIDAPHNERADVPAEVETICLACLAREPADRLASAGEVESRLRAWLSGDDSTPARPSGGTETRRRRFLLTGAVVGSVAAAAVTALLLVFGGSHEDGPPEEIARRAVTETPDVPERDTPLTWRGEVFRAGAQEPQPLVQGVSSGDRLRLHARLESPRYVSVFWIGSDGTVQSLDEEGPPAEPVEAFSLPRSAGHVLPVGGPPGTEVCVVLVRHEPLDDPAALAEALAPRFPLPPLDGDVVLADGEPLLSGPVDEPSLAQLRHPSRVIGPAEPLLGGAAAAALARWREGLPADAGWFHYVAIPHVAR